MDVAVLEEDESDILEVEDILVLTLVVTYDEEKNSVSKFTEIKSYDLPIVKKR
jgi:hypothetical protein